MWKGYLSETQTTEIATSSLEGKLNQSLPAIILDNRLFRLNWLLMEYVLQPNEKCIARAQALKSQWVKKRPCMVQMWKWHAHLCQLWEQFVLDGFEWRPRRNMMVVTKDAQSDVSNYWGYLKPVETAEMSRRSENTSWEDRIEIHGAR